MQRFLISLFFFLSLSFSALYAQPAFYTFSHFGVEHGLSQNTVYCTLQDSKGFLWIGTGDGLNRYDGRSFRVFKHNPQDPASLSNSVIRYIFEDRSGKIWVTTEAGLNLYDPQTEEFSIINPVPGASSAHWAKTLDQDSRGHLWILLMGRSLVDFDPASHQSKEYSYRENTSAYQGFSYFDKAANKLWLVSKDTLSCFDLLKPGFTHYPLRNKKYPEGAYLLPFKKQYLLVCDNEGIQVFDRVKRQFVKDEPLGNIWFSPRKLCGIQFDNKGNLWVVSSSFGITIYSPTGQELASYAAGQSCGDCLKADILTGITVDKSGNIWLGTDGYGIARVNGLNNKFNLLVAKDRNPYRFSNSYIRCVTEDHLGQVWVGTLAGGVNILNRQTGVMRYLSTTTQPRLPSDNVYCIYEDRFQMVWIATDEGLTRFDPKTNKLETIPLPAVPGQPQMATRIVERENGELWIAVKGLGLAYCKPNPGLRPVFTVYEPLRGKTVSNFFTDHAKNLWVVNPWDLFVVSPGKEFLKVPHAGKVHDYAFKNIATAGCQDIYGNLWIGSHSGLVRINEKDRFDYLDENTGLANNYIYDVVADDAGFIWVSSNKGLSRVNARTLEVRNYGINDGLQSFEFNSNAWHKSKRGIFYWGGVYGLNWFYPDSVKDDGFRPHLELTGFAVNDKPDRPGNWLGKSGTINLSYNQNYLYFEFSSLDLTHPEAISYAYRIEELNDEWLQLKNQNFIRLNGLSPGSYTLQVKATNSNGAWNSDALSYSFIISPPYWARTWFRVLIGAAILGFVAFAVSWYSRQRYNRKLAELKRKQEIDAIRNRISRDIHDEIGSGLTRISIISERLKHNVSGQAEGISEALDNLQSQSRDMVDSLNEIVWTVNPMNDTLDSLMAHIRSYAADYLENGGLACRFSFPDTIPDIPVRPEFRRNLLLVIKEALNNILKYAWAKEVDITFRLEEKGAFTLTITDDGKGLKQGDKPTGGGNGIRNMRNRMAEIGGGCTVYSEPGGGVSVHIAGNILVNTTF